MSSSAEYAAGAPVPITSLQYRDISSRRGKAHPTQDEADQEPVEQPNKKENDPGVSEALLIARIEREIAEAVTAAEQRLRHEYEQKLAAARAPIPPGRMPACAKAAVWAACVIVALPAVWAAFLTYYGGFLILFLLAFTGLTLTIGTTTDRRAAG